MAKQLLRQTLKKNGESTFEFRFALVAAILLGLLILSIAAWPWQSFDSAPPAVSAPAVAPEQPEVPVHLGSGLDVTGSDLSLDRQLLAGGATRLGPEEQPADAADSQDDLDTKLHATDAPGSGEPVVTPGIPGMPGTVAGNYPADKKRKRRRIGVDIAFILGMSSAMAWEALQGSSSGNSGPPTIVNPPGGEPGGGSPTSPPKNPVFPPHRPRRPIEEPGAGSSSGSGGGQNGPPPSGSGPGTGSGNGGTGPSSGTQPPSGSSGSGTQNPTAPGSSPVTSSSGSGSNPPSEPTSSGGGYTPISQNSNPPLVNPNPPQPNVVPEPDFRPLLVLGVAAIGFIRWRKGRSR